MTEQSFPPLIPESIYWKRVLGDRYDEVLDEAIWRAQRKPESSQTQPEARPMDVEGSPSREYLERVDKLEEAVKQCVSLSNRCEGIRSPTQAHYYASLLFTSLCVRSLSLALLTPFSRLSRGNYKHWDHMTIAGITRSILEFRLAFFYLCAQKCSPEEWDCRLILFHLHDCQSRIIAHWEPSEGPIALPSGTVPMVELWRSPSGDVLQVGLPLIGHYGEKAYRATVEARGIRYDGKLYESPSAAARAVKKRARGLVGGAASTNGRDFWKIEDPKSGRLVSLRQLKPTPPIDTEELLKEMRGEI